MSKLKITLPIDVLLKAAKHAQIEMHKKGYVFRILKIDPKKIVRPEDIIETDSPRALALFTSIVKTHAMDFYKHGLGQRVANPRKKKTKKQKNPGSSPRVSKRSYKLIDEVYGENAPLVGSLAEDVKKMAIRQVVSPINSLAQTYMHYKFGLDLENAFNFKKGMSEEEKKAVRLNQIRRFYVTKMLAKNLGEALKTDPDKVDSDLKKLGIDQNSSFEDLASLATREKITKLLS